MTSEDITKLMWAFSTMDVTPTDLFEKLISAAKPLMPHFNSLQITDCVSACGMMMVGGDNTSLEEMDKRQRLCQSMMQLVDRQNYYLCSHGLPEQLASIVMGFAKVHADSERLLPESAAVLAKYFNDSKVNIQCVTQTLWAYSHLGVKSLPLLHATVDQMKRGKLSSHELSAPQIIRLLWSISEQEYFLDDDFLMELRGLIAALQHQLSNSPKSLSHSSALLLHQVSLSLRLQVPSVSSIFEKEPAWLEK